MNSNGGKMIYVLNAIIVPFEDNKAVFEIKRINTEIAKIIAKSAVEKNELVSAIGHSATADILSMLLDVNIPTNRVSIFFKPGDEAIAFVLKKRLQEGQVIKSVEELDAIGYDLYHITRLS